MVGHAVNQFTLSGDSRVFLCSRKSAELSGGSRVFFFSRKSADFLPAEESLEIHEEFFYVVESLRTFSPGATRPWTPARVVLQRAGAAHSCSRTFSTRTTVNANGPNHDNRRSKRSEPDLDLNSLN